MSRVVTNTETCDVCTRGWVVSGFSDVDPRPRNQYTAAAAIVANSSASRIFLRDDFSLTKWSTNAHRRQGPNDRRPGLQKGSISHQLLNATTRVPYPSYPVYRSLIKAALT